MSDAAFLPGAGEPGLVSIVIPTYNRAYIIAATIESALRQTYANVEVLVADDGSKDDTRAIVEAFGDPRVRYLWQPNAGCPAARNLAIRHARGEFIALLDSDDRWMPWKLEAQVALLRAHPEVGMVWTDMTAVNDAGELVEERHLRTFYGAYAEVEIEQVLERRGTLGELLPAVDPALASAPVYTGDLFSHLLLGSLVHTPTVVLRRDRVRQTACARAGRSNTRTRRSSRRERTTTSTCARRCTGRSASSTCPRCTIASATRTRSRRPT